MKKLILITGLLAATTAHAGPYADIAKAKFESEMVQAIQLTDKDQSKKSDAISQLPGIQKQLRGIVREELKEKKSCLKIKRDFVKEQKELMDKEDWPDKDFAESSLSASADYIATICLDMK
ncbi:hypothetical protein [Yersinia enterocolitica]|uniref:hypothetical protein n=1 Tax=Yersinia enterocolitica TaxID=630 RepID=UPI0005E9DE9D|nr:hypothetical protein [Yersinia enterocolitica]CQJ65480.1 Uncharacterised protein [Yersinia enterocolitica]